ncbi:MULTISPECIES: Rieske (2Fe-2S) protein [unclassified Streptomyces]|uniref:Rieske (2Fe-2S) protein n=1 Tax=unclassified Streptomyces TaxID=2593676 RepID=UPI001F047655|nr:MULTISPECIES: Rieske (2Fe-2S) protein [unclassified Streptomyces]MCH0567158.1 Rieske (2Fe-2S) protein [Streptomyces sp. MUM 2J]MCH0572733.1 Rieske (2Fe-2S) protein [Streptomyces sp. MUM 136J]
MTHVPTRRTVLLTTGAVALAAGCGEYGGGDSGSSASAGQELARTDEIPVGGGRIFAAEKVVVTQPERGDFRAFSAICTHQGCTVNTVAEGTIDCPCHGSRFRITDGSVARPPATRPLPEKKISVEGDRISLA